MESKEQLLKDIGIVSFTLTELSLYLDTHPQDCGAMEYFNHYNKIRQQMVKDFSQKYYPLNLDNVECSREWKWGDAPLPWEGECV